MKKLLKELRNDRSLSSLFIVCVAFSLFWLVYDIVNVAGGVADLDKHVPFLMPIVFGAIAGCILAIVHCSASAHNANADR